MDFSGEIKKLYNNLKQFPLKDIEINVDGNFIAYSIKDEMYNGLYTIMCCEIKDTVKHNHPDISITCIPPEGCKNSPENLRRKIIIDVNKEITNFDKKQEILCGALVDFNGILKELIKYRYKE